jgi:enoyl-CoA hydratase
MAAITPEGEPEILLERRGDVALVTLNRPKALNTLTLGMYRELDPDLLAWRRDRAVRAVIIRGAGDKSFCAGGDVRDLWKAGQGVKGADDLKSVFFREEYRLIQRVHRLGKPYVALMDGITMGGGVGMSINGSHRVATENTAFAMPETAIGLFPDVGATHFLNRCPGRIGIYLALSGTRLKAADLWYCGLATHFVPRDRLDDVVEMLTQIEWHDGVEERQADLALSRLAENPGPAPLLVNRAAIDRCFAADKTVEGILDALRRERTDWARETLASLERASPSSLKVTHRQMTIGRKYSVEQALVLEYRLTQHFMENPDFFEGVRAVLVDKDQQPKWRPDKLEAVSDEVVASYFRELGPNELTFID